MAKKFHVLNEFVGLLLLLLFCDLLNNGEALYLSKVNYLDYSSEKIDIDIEKTLLRTVYHKRKSFEHEQELRVFIHKTPREFFDKIDEKDYNISGNGRKFWDAPSDIVGGIKLDVDIEELIEKIYVSPKAPRWFFELVQEVVEKYKLDIEVVKSDLYEEELY